MSMQFVLFAISTLAIASSIHREDVHFTIEDKV